MFKRIKKFFYNYLQISRKSVSDTNNNINSSAAVLYVNDETSLSIPYTDFINNGDQNHTQLMVEENELDKILYFDFPKLDSYDVKYYIAYDDDKYIILNQLNNVRVHIPIISPDTKCYFTKIAIILTNKDDTREFYKLEITPIYNFDLSNYTNGVDNFKLYKDDVEISYTTELESSIYHVDTNGMSNGTIYIKPEPADGTYIIKIYDIYGTVIQEKTNIIGTDNLCFDYNEDINKVVFYKISNKNNDACVIYFSK